MITRGHQYTLVMISITKLCLKGEIPPDMRLKFLQHLDKMCDQVITPEVIASIEPMCEDAYEIVQEAIKLGPKKALDVYADKFEVFATLNPTLRIAA